MSRKRENVGSLGERARYWLSDEGWAQYQVAERNYETTQAAGRGPRPVHVESFKPVGEIVRLLAAEIPRKDAVTFVAGWKMILGGLEVPFEDMLSSDMAIRKWFPEDDIMTVAFGPHWADTLRAGQRKKELATIREEVEAWLRTVEETLP